MCRSSVVGRGNVVGHCSIGLHIQSIGQCVTAFLMSHKQSIKSKPGSQVDS